MSQLPVILRNSRLARPWVALADVTGAQIARWVQNAAGLGRVQALGEKLHPAGGKPLAGAGVFRLLLTVGVAGLFALLCFATTGVIGAATGLLLLLALIGAVWFRPAFLHRLTVVDLLVVCFLASAAVSTAFSSFTHTSVIGLAKMLTFVAGYAVFRVLSESGARTIGSLMALLMLLGLGESLVGLYQHVHHIQPLATWSDQSVNPELQMDRIFGTLKPSNPNLLAGFLIPCIAGALGVGLMFLRQKTVVLSLFGFGAVALMLVALVLTGSRGGFLAIAVMFAWVFGFLGHLIWHDRELRPFRWLKPVWLIVLLVSLLAIGGGVVSSEKIRTRVASIFAMREDSSISYRFNVYNSAFRMAKDNLIVGIGPGNGTFKLVYGLYMVPGYNALGSYSVPLEITVEQGVIGLVIFLSLLLVLILRTMLTMDAPWLDLRRKMLVGALLTGILGSFMYGVFDTIWYRPSVNLLFWFMVAALARLTEPQALNTIEEQR